jgi:hypothetical protein
MFNAEALRAAKTAHAHLAASLRRSQQRGHFPR